MKSPQNMRFVSPIIILLSTCSLPALAQSNGPSNIPDQNIPDQLADDDNDDNVIIVTAQKIEQRSTDVPITISALSGDRLEELGVSDLDELSNFVPGLNIQEQSANNPGIVIRGITSDSGSAQQAARVTLYYNGIDISRSRGSFQAIYDLDRVEVIKGPQATLFGTASAVGAISLVSARPREGYSGEIYGGYGNFNQYLLGGHINAGSDVLAVRLAGEFRQRDGYVTNLAPNQADLNGQNQLGFRGSVRYTPNVDVTADLIFTYDRQRNPGTAFISGTFATPAGPADPFGAAFLGGSPLSEAVLGDAELGLTRDVYDVNYTLSYDFADNWNFTTVNGVRRFNSNEVFDADGSAAFFLEFAEDARGNQYSHEARFSYNDPSFRASFGWNYFRESSLQRVPFSSEEGIFLQCAANLIPGLPCVADDGTVPAANATAILTGGVATFLPNQSEFTNLGENDSYSVFADGTYIPTDAIEVTAGARILIEKRRSGFRSTVQPSVITGGPSLIPGQVDTGGQTFEVEDSFAAILPRFNILYRLSDQFNAFATISKGRRSDTVALNAASTPDGPVANFTAIAAENVWNYEVGLKGAAGIFSGALGVYYQEYSNFQVNVIGDDGISRPQSIGSATNFGVEAEIFAKPTNWLSIFANIGYIDGGIDDIPSNGNFAGSRFRLQPEIQAAGGFTVDYPINNSVRFFATPTVTHRSRIFFEQPNSLLISQDAVTLVNIRAGLSFADERFEIAGFARNLTNEDFLLDAGNTGGAFGIPTFIPGEPRLYGVQLTARF